MQGNAPQPRAVHQVYDGHSSAHSVQIFPHICLCPFLPCSTGRCLSDRIMRETSMLASDTGNNCTLQAPRPKHLIKRTTKQKGRSAHLPVAPFTWGDLLGFHSVGLESDLNLTSTCCGGETLLMAQFPSCDLGVKASSLTPLSSPFLLYMSNTNTFYVISQCLA